METNIRDNNYINTMNVSYEEIFNEIEMNLNKEKIELQKNNLFENNTGQKIFTEDDSEKLHLSLILDDDNKLSLDISPSDNIEDMCIDICKRNKLDLNIAKKLKKRIEEQISILRSEKQSYSRIKEEQIVNRLYTEAMKRKIMKDKYFEKMKNELKEKELNNYSFTPKISQNSNILYNRSHLRIEDKLFYEEVQKKEKRNFMRIINDVRHKDNLEKNIDRNKSKIKKSINKNELNVSNVEKEKKVKNDNNRYEMNRNCDNVEKKNFNEALDHLQNGFNKDNSHNISKHSPNDEFIKKSNFLFHNINKNDKNSDYSTNVNILNHLNVNENQINKKINSKEKQDNNPPIGNGINDENRDRVLNRKSLKDSPQIFSKNKSQFNIHADRDENFSKIIKFNHNPQRGSLGQINPLNNFVFKSNTGNTYSNIHKNNISYNSSKNQNEQKNGNKRNSFSNKKIISSTTYNKNNNNLNLHEMSTSDFKGGSVEKMDNCFYLKLSRSPNIDDNEKTRGKIIDQEKNDKKDLIFAGESMISNEEYKIIKKSNDILNKKFKNGNVFNNNNSQADSEKFFDDKKNVKNKNEDNNNLSLKFPNKSINNIKGDSDDKRNFTKIKPDSKKIFRGNDNESEFSKEYKSLKEDSNKKQYKNNFERLYYDAQETKRLKEKYVDFITKRECPFTPQISENSRILIKSTNRSEDKQQIYRRLAQNKNNEHDLRKSRSKLSMSSNNIMNNSNTENKNLLKISRNYNTESESSNRIRTKITIREQKSENEIYATIDELNNKTNKLRKSIDRKLKENMGKYKLNNLKEVFEIIFSKCNSIQDVQNLGKYGISSSMKDNVILPTLNLIQERSLEFNFQNFYLAANEIINSSL